MNFVIPEPKIVNYLLTNPKKCGFFLRLGYSIQNWTRLRDDILSLTQHCTVTFKRENEFGKKYEIIGKIQTPDGRTIKIITAWMVLSEDPGTARFVTAYRA